MADEIKGLNRKDYDPETWAMILEAESHARWGAANTFAADDYGPDTGLAYEIAKLQGCIPGSDGYELCFLYYIDGQAVISFVVAEGEGNPTVNVWVPGVGGLKGG